MEPNVMLTVGSYDKQGGTNTFVRNLSARLASNGIKTVVMSHKLKGETFKDRKVKKNLDVYYFPAFPRKRYFLPLYLFRFIAMSIMIIPIIIRHRINVILTGETEALPFLVARLLGVKVIIRGGNPFPQVTKIEFGRKERFLNKIVFLLIDVYEKIILAFSNRVVILSEWERAILHRYTKKKLDMIRYAVDVNTFKPGKRNKQDYLIYVGRISYSKNIDKLVECFNKIREKRKAKLVLVGPLEDYDSIDALLEKTEHPRDIIYKGEMKAEKIPALLAESKIFVHAAFDLGNAPLEAASCGLPVVVMGSKFDEEYVIKSSSTKDFAAKVVDLLTNKSKYNKISINNREFVEANHSWEKVTEQYIEIFNRTVNNNGRK